jgi:methylated-DNA-[protein]-cysteine S-methyltransferase
MEKLIGEMMIIHHHQMESAIGKLALLSSDEGLCYVGFAGKGDRGKRFLKKYFPGAEVKTGGKYNREAARQITAYLAGRLRKFSVKLDLRAAGFNRQVLLKVKAIPYGKVRTYGEIAAALKSPKAARAVGNANRLNPIPIIIPCHRVIAAGGLGGYGGGLPLKKKLLAMEKAIND